MPDSKITALASTGTGTDPAVDPLVIVDVSDTTMAASGTTKKVTLNQLLACSPTATLASATITGALGAAGLNVTGATIPANGVYLGSANNLSFSAASTLGMTLNSTGLGLGVSPITALSFPIGTTKVVAQSATTAHAAGNVGTLKFGISDGGGDYSGLHVVNSHNGTYSSQDLLFFTGEGGVSLCTERMRITRSGNVGVGVTPSGSGGCLQLKSGITFPATQVASSDANTLDDYEEGTWTGTLKGSVSDPTTPVTATGAYTKVGRLVTVTIAYANVTTTGASGNVTITGLPFAGASTGAGSVITFDMFTTSTTLACWNVGTTIAFYVSGGFIPATHNAGASRSVNVTMTYFV